MLDSYPIDRQCYSDNRVLYARQDDCQEWDSEQDQRHEEEGPKIVEGEGPDIEDLEFDCD